MAQKYRLFAVQVVNADDSFVPRKGSDFEPFVTLNQSEAEDLAADLNDNTETFHVAVELIPEIIPSDATGIEGVVRAFILMSRSQGLTKAETEETLNLFLQQTGYKWTRKTVS